MTPRSGPGSRPVSSGRSARFSPAGRYPGCAGTRGDASLLARVHEVGASHLERRPADPGRHRAGRQLPGRHAARGLSCSSDSAFLLYIPAFTAASIASASTTKASACLPKVDRPTSSVVVTTTTPSSSAIPDHADHERGRTGALLRAVGLPDRPLGWVHAVSTFRSCATATRCHGSIRDRAGGRPVRE